jgi:hypothetical protein
MGWNSWDAYGLTIDEAEFKSNVTAMAGLKQFGWQYAVVDEGWYMRNPAGTDLATREYLYDRNGLLIPVVEHFPSAANGAGFRPLADWVHAQGLKFGLHIVRGIPKTVVQANLPIAGSSFHAAEAADTTEGSPWEDSNYGVRDNAAGQAYYDSMFRQFARWRLDFIKVDCISARPYRPTEIRQIALAIKHSGRSMVLSLSPGPTALENAAALAEYGQTWRISDDHWDLWSAPQKLNDAEFPFSLSEAFDRVEKWIKYAKPGSWPDEDMLPLGSLTPRPGWGAPRQSRLTRDEQRTEFTLWAFARSPLIVGANLTRLDDFTRSLLMNRDLINVDQHGVNNHPVKFLSKGFEHVRVWESKDGVSPNSDDFFAFFNLDDKPTTLTFTWDQLGHHGLSEAHSLFGGEPVGSTGRVQVTIPAHGCAAYKLADRNSFRQSRIAN